MVHLVWYKVRDLDYFVPVNEMKTCQYFCDRLEEETLKDVKSYRETSEGP